MNAPTYLGQLAGQLNSTYVPKCSTFKESNTVNVKGAIIGARKGYLVALALTRTGRNSGFAMMVRFPTTAASQQMQEAIKSKPGFSSFFNKKSVKTTENRLTVSWIYALRKPNPEEVVSLLDALIEEVSRYAPAYGGKCEDCSTTETRDITLRDGVPGYHCLSCQMRITAEKLREAEDYKAKEANYGLGVAAGLLAAAVAGTAWGELGAWIEAGSDKWYPQLHGAATILISIAVTWAVFRAVGKRDRTGQVLAVLLTLAAKWWGDTLYYSHVIAETESIPFTSSLVVQTLKNLFVFKLHDGLHWIVFGCDLGFSAWIPWMPWGRLPKFEPVFQTINPDGSLTQTLARAAGAQ